MTILLPPAFSFYLSPFPACVPILCSRKLNKKKERNVVLQGNGFIQTKDQEIWGDNSSGLQLPEFSHTGIVMFPIYVNDELKYVF